MTIIEFLLYKIRNEYKSIEAKFKFRRRCNDKFKHVLACIMFETIDYSFSNMTRLHICFKY